MPFYNCRETLAPALISVIRQTYPNWELLLCDDGSTDGSLACARSFRDDRIVLSPDGRRLVMLSCDAKVKGIPRNEDVMLRILTLADKKVTVLAKLIGGQGTIDAPSWSPDGRRLSFVSYQLLPK